MGSPLFDSVKKVFSGENWAFSEVAEREVLQAGFEARNGRVELHVQAFPELAAVSVVSESTYETGDHPARRERLAELVMRANCALTVGNFEMDWDQGKVFFRVTNLFSDQAGDEKIIRGLVHNTILEMDGLTPAIAMIARSEGADLAGLDLERLLRGAEDSAPHP
jgi:hypothetical protein